MAAAANAAGASDVGLVRSNNEDAYAIADDIWVVADGLGGHAGGEVASGLAVQGAVRALTEDGADLVAAVTAAHDLIIETSREHPELAGMGTTLVLAQRDADGRVRIANVGDSRAYLLADDELVQLTVDDNHAQELVDRGELTPEQARVHPGQYWISKALGLGDRDAPSPTITELPTTRGRLLLCTDGLNSELTDTQIGELLAEGDSAQACEALVAAALLSGGGDNVTVVAVDL